MACNGVIFALELGTLPLKEKASIRQRIEAAGGSVTAVIGTSVRVVITTASILASGSYKLSSAEKLSIPIRVVEDLAQVLASPPPPRDSSGARASPKAEGKIMSGSTGGSTLISWNSDASEAVSPSEAPTGDFKESTAAEARADEDEKDSNPPGGLFESDSNDDPPGGFFGSEPIKTPMADSREHVKAENHALEDEDDDESPGGFFEREETFAYTEEPRINHSHRAVKFVYAEEEIDGGLAALAGIEGLGQATNSMYTPYPGDPFEDEDEGETFDLFGD